MANGQSPAEWSRLNVFLHWLIVMLIIAQWIEGEYMGGLWDATLENKSVAGATAFLGYTHIVCGCLILAAALIRLADRWTRGRPPHSARDPLWAIWFARISHLLLYAIILVMPVLGLAAWFTGNDTLAHYHTFFWTPLLVVAGLHICGALAQHFVFKTPALARMVPGLKPLS